MKNCYLQLQSNRHIFPNTSIVDEKNLIYNCRWKFLAVQNSSIGDLVTDWLTHWLTDSVRTLLNLSARRSQWIDECEAKPLLLLLLLLTMNWTNLTDERQEWGNQATQITPGAEVHLGSMEKMQNPLWEEQLQSTITIRMLRWAGGALGQRKVNHWYLLGKNSRKWL